LKKEKQTESRNEGQITKDVTPNPQSSTNNYLVWIISLDIFWTRIIYLHAHPQILYYSCVKLNQQVFMSTEGVMLMRN